MTPNPKQLDPIRLASYRSFASLGSRWSGNFPRSFGDAADESGLSNWDDPVWTAYRMQGCSRQDQSTEFYRVL